MKKYAVICSLLLGIVSGCGQKKAVAPKLEDITQKSGNCYSCTFDGVKHGFIIDMPDNSDNAPLVLMLHGYGSSAEDFRTSVQFEKDANPLGYAVVYVTGAPDPLPRQQAGTQLTTPTATVTPSSLCHWQSICKRSIPSIRQKHTPWVSATALS